jgi:hypothetical protein
LAGRRVAARDVQLAQVAVVVWRTSANERVQAVCAVAIVLTRTGEAFVGWVFEEDGPSFVIGQSVIVRADVLDVADEAGRLKGSVVIEGCGGSDFQGSDTAERGRTIPVLEDSLDGVLVAVDVDLGRRHVDRGPRVAHDRNMSPL